MKRFLLLATLTSFGISGAALADSMSNNQPMSSQPMPPMSSDKPMMMMNDKPTMSAQPMQHPSMDQKPMMSDKPMNGHDKQ